MEVPTHRIVGTIARFAFGLLAVLVVGLSAACQKTRISQVQDFPIHQLTVPGSLSIVSWNGQKGQNPAFRADLARLIATEQPDLIFVQEATGDMLNSRQIGGYFASSWSYPWPGGKTIGMLTLSRVEPVNITPLPSRHREFFITAPKLSLLTEYLLPNGERLLTVNVHLLAFERWNTRGIRAQLEDIKTAIDRHPGPVILLGDMNTWNHKRLAILQAAAIEANLTEVTDFPPGRRGGAGDSAWINWLLGVNPELPLDRVYQRGFEDRSARVLAYGSSDHRPLLVTLELKHRQPAQLSTLSSQ